MDIIEIVNIGRRSRNMRTVQEMFGLWFDYGARPEFEVSQVLGFFCFEFRFVA